MKNKNSFIAGRGMAYFRNADALFLEDESNKYTHVQK